jgi:serine/threonine protein kinase
MSWMTEQPLPNNICGTSSYMAPELFKNNHVNTFENMKRIDSWALGVLVYFTAYEKTPFICYPTARKLWETIST